MLTRSLDVVRDDAERLTCLESYCCLKPPVPKGNSPGFCIQEDQRRRILVRWQGGEKQEDSEEGWRVSYAFPAHARRRQLFETLGLGAVDWLWDGFNAAIVALGPQHGKPDVLFGAGSSFVSLCLEEICRRAADNPNRYCLGLSAWELRGREAKDLFASVHDEQSDLSFEAVRFQTFQEASELLAVAHRKARPQEWHNFVRVVVLDGNQSSLAALHFVEIACGDGPLTADRRALTKLLEAASTGLSVDAGPSRLEEVLSPLLLGNCKSFLCFCVPAAPQGTQAAEARCLLDLAERASLITSRCSRLSDVRRSDIRLTEPQVIFDPQPRMAHEPRVASAERAAGVPEALGTGRTDGFNNSEDGLVLFDGYSGSSARKELRQTVLTNSNNNKSMQRFDQRDYQTVAKHSYSDAVENYSGSADKYSGAADRLDSLASAAQSQMIDHHSGTFADSDADARELLRLRSAHARRLEEYEEMLVSTAELRKKANEETAHHAAKLKDVRSEVADLRKELLELEDAQELGDEVPAILRLHRDEVNRVRLEIKRLKEDNAVLAGPKDERRRKVRRVTLLALQSEALKLKESAHDFDKADKRAALTRRCLDEVRNRLGLAKEQLKNVQGEHDTLKKISEGLGERVAAALDMHRKTQGELDQHKHASNGLRIQIDALKDARHAIEVTPEAVPHPGKMKTSGLEQIDALRRQLLAYSSQLAALCDRIRAEHEELLQGCGRLEERQRRLQRLLGNVASDGLEASSSGLSRSWRPQSILVKGDKSLQSESGNPTPRASSAERGSPRVFIEDHSPRSRSNSATTVATTVASTFSPRLQRRKSYTTRSGALRVGALAHSGHSAVELATTTRASSLSKSSSRGAGKTFLPHDTEASTPTSPVSSRRATMLSQDSDALSGRRSTVQLLLPAGLPGSPTPGVAPRRNANKISK